MPISLRLRPLKFSSLFGITLHNNCIKRLHNCSTKSLAQRRDSTTSQATARTKQKKPKLTTQNVISVFLSSPSNRHHLPPNLPVVSSLASCTCFPCTVTSFTSPKIINPLPSKISFPNPGATIKLPVWPPCDRSHWFSNWVQKFVNFEKKGANDTCVCVAIYPWAYPANSNMPNCT